MRRGLAGMLAPMQRPPFRDRELRLLFAAFATAACVFAFVGLSTSGFWTDELFTLFVVGHHGGLGEVWTRALTDTHPPAYYFLLYGWSRLFGLSEPAVRLLSAFAAVGAAAVFFLGLRDVFSTTARAFALALSLNATFWFDQAQNTRSYSVCMLVSAVMLVAALAARRQARAGRTPWGPGLALMAVGLLGSFCHSYVFLETGLVYVFLVLTVPSTPLRLALIAWGVLIAGLDLAFDRILLGHTLQDVRHMWFRNDAKFFFDQITVAWRISVGISGAVALAILAAFAWRRRKEAAADAPADRGWIAALALFAHLGMFVLGLAVSLLVAPSMSSLNFAAAAPLFWTLAAWLYDKGVPRLETAGGQVVAGLMLLATVTHLPVLAGRFLVRTEDWRGSARYVAGLKACAGETIPVVLPAKFGPDTPFFHTLAEQSFYGRYFPDPARLRAWPAAALTGRASDPRLAALIAARARGTDPCPVLAWGAHDLEPDEAAALREGLARRPDVAPAGVEMKTFPHAGHEEISYGPWASAFVYLVAPPIRR